MKQGHRREDGWYYRGFFDDREQWSSPQAWHNAKVSNTLFNIKNRIKNTDIPFNLDSEYLRSIYPEDERCPIFRFELVWNGDRRNSPSLDRIVPELGYIKGNVEWMSDLANRMKTNATPQELLAFAHYLIKKYGENGVPFKQ